MGSSAQIHQIRPKLKSGNYIELKVSDTGVGIETHIIEKKFEPYFTTKIIGEGACSSSWDY